jgi:Zn-finger nucleic acid-binding protein
MDCPNCQVKMKDTYRQGVKIDYCGSCRGIWLERGELDKIIQRTLSLAMPFPVPVETGEAVEDDIALTSQDHSRNNTTGSGPSKFYLSELFELE